MSLSLFRAALAAATLALGACAHKPLTFAAYGDMPYQAHVADGRTDEQVLLQDIAPRLRADPAIPFIIHVGDIGRPEMACNDAYLEHTRAHWARDLAKPVLYTPGDNEWMDCDRDKVPHAGSELARLDAVRRIFFSTPVAAPPEWQYRQQAGQPENASWQKDGVHFVTLHVVSKGNGREQVLKDDPAAAAQLAAQRDANNRTWLEQAFARARDSHGGALVIAMQFDLFGAPDGGPGAFERCARHAVYGPVCRQIRDGAVAFGRPVLLVHGDTNAYCLDQPFGSTAAPLLWRLNAPGDYAPIDAAIVRVEPDAAQPFQVTGLLSAAPPPAVCDYTHH
ncbi:hypothetical protein GCM10027277_56260 [Pseudoduganella ginsengisoli]|uniref:Calcineurin-like phosphoesterase domain-containing protein n=1 Tax=Pseudoduganella ginsengisoli TaxID=1462440 RepID=A0A6L6Q468_9BURK|nr:hypothetical protein [Pseudoduganella ginsengisoli]MTW03998.1 hypothetical protein [Pseudoduganella ginsengisoli]